MSYIKGGDDGDGGAWPGVDDGYLRLLPTPPTTSVTRTIIITINRDAASGVAIVNGVGRVRMEQDDVVLARWPRGRAARVVGVDGARELQQRLLMLGIRRGIEMRVLHGPGSRGVVVQVGAARIALGRSVVESIRVAPVVEDGA